VLNFQVVEHIREPLPFLRVCVRSWPLLAPAVTTPNRLMSSRTTRTTCGSIPRRPRGPADAGLQSGDDPRDARQRHGSRVRRQRARRCGGFCASTRSAAPRLPRSVVQFAFARLAVWVRRRAGSAAGAPTITPDDFHVNAEHLAEPRSCRAVRGLSPPQTTTVPGRCRDSVFPSLIYLRRWPLSPSCIHAIPPFWVRDSPRSKRFIGT